MTDKQLIREQTEEIVRWCGFTQNNNLKSGYHYEFSQKISNWYYPDGNVCWNRGHKGERPDLDLNFFFQYVVPKLRKKYPELLMRWQFGSCDSFQLYEWGKKYSAKKNFEWL